MAGPRVAISATFTAEPLREPLEFLLQLLGWTEPVEFAPFAQVLQTLLDPSGLFARNRDGVNVVLARAADLNSDELALAVQAFPGTTPLLRICPANDGAAGIHDPQADALGAIPYTPAYFASLAWEIAREAHRMRHPAYKVIAVDCDDTLWSGVCGEDGPAGVTLDPPRRALQQFLLTQRSTGKLLAIASKNNENDVRETFLQHPEMPLRLSDFTTRRIGWQSKSIGLQEMAAELSLSLDSFVFVDDNPKECAELAAALPEVATVTLPADAAQIPDFLTRIWAFDPPAQLTEEDRHRNAAYAQQTERTQWEQQSRSLEDFIRGLELVVEIAPIRESDIARVAQLTQRTNQMNFSTRRRSEADIRDFLARGTGLAVRARDRFGDYGLVGAMLLDEATVDTFLLSCRALGRGVEHAMLRRIGELAAERGFDAVTIPFVETKRNTPARDFLASVRSFSARDLACLAYKPAKSAPSIPRSAAALASRAPDYQRIAELSDPMDLLAAIHARKLSQAPRFIASEPPRTGLEHHLCALWTELLGVPSLGIHDNFFDLGGHSLLAVQLVARLHRHLNVDLPLEAVYTGTLTVAELARSIEIFQLGQLDESEYAALLAEVEGLSDEQAEALLSQELDADAR